jgi:hypothetical protein
MVTFYNFLYFNNKFHLLNFISQPVYSQKAIPAYFGLKVYSQAYRINSVDDVPVSLLWFKAYSPKRIKAMPVNSIESVIYVFVGIGYLIAVWGIGG